jgi:hypothetical protein
VRYVDPSGLKEKDYTIDIEKYLNTELTVEFHIEGRKGEPVTATFGGETYTLGEDLNWGDSVPFDTVFNISEGAGIELSSGDANFKLKGEGKVSLINSINAYNQLVTSRRFKKAMRREQAKGVIQAGFGLGIMTLGLYTAAKSTELTGGAAIAAGNKAYGTFIFGAGLLSRGIVRASGGSKHSVIKDIRNSAMPPIYSH